MKFLSSFTKNPEKRKVYGRLVAFSFFLLVLGYLLKYLGAPELIPHFANEIAIAGLVGFFLAITIEDLSQREFHELAERERAEIKRNVFYYVYGHEIPLSIRDEIDAHILKVPYVRRKVEMKYDLQLIQDPKTKEWYVLATLTMSYDLENLTTEKVTFPFSAAIDKSPSEQLAHHTRFIELSVTGCEKPFKLDEAALKLKQKEEDQEYSLRLPNEIVLPPKRSPDDANQPPASTSLTRVTLKTKTVRSLRHGHIDFIFTSHICDLELLVLADRGLKVNPDTSEQNPLEQAALPPQLSWVREAVSDNRQLYYWKLKKPLLAYQSLQIFWAPEDAEFDQATAKEDGQVESKKL